MSEHASLYENTRRFWLVMIGLVVLLVALPIVVTKAFDLDPRTPSAVALDTLHADYGLVPVDAKGVGIPEGSSTATVSIFSVQPGASTGDVPFRQSGKPVLCTVSVSGEPASVTATCEDKPS